MSLKKPTTYREQLALIREYGFIIDNECEALRFLNHASYYRLSGYFLPFQNKNKRVDSIHFSKFIHVYQFDSRLRQWILAAIEDIEQYAKTQIAYYVVHTYGPTGYLNEAIYSRRHKHTSFLENLSRIKKQNQHHPVLKHHNKHYEGALPLWAAIEFFSLGALSIFYADLHTRDGKK